MAPLRIYRIDAFTTARGEGNPAGVKCVLKHMNLCQQHLRLPLVPVSEGTENKIIEFLKTL